MENHPVCVCVWKTVLQEGRRGFSSTRGCNPHIPTTSEVTGLLLHMSIIQSPPHPHALIHTLENQGKGGRL